MFLVMCDVTVIVSVGFKRSNSCLRTVLKRPTASSARHLACSSNPRPKQLCHWQATDLARFQRDGLVSFFFFFWWGGEV